MFCLDWLHAGRATRGKPRRDRHRCRSWPTLGLLACIALLQSGCQSGPLAHCGDGSKLFGPCGFFSRVSDRMFTRTNQAGCCQPGVVGETTIVDGVPGAVVTPGVVSPSYSSGTQRVIVPPGSTDSSTELSPANPVDPTARSKVVSPPPGNGASRSGTGPQGASYQTRQDSGARLARRRTESNIKTTVTTSEPTAGSAQEPARTGSDGQSAAEPDPLDNIPPLDLPGDAPRSSSSTPPGPPAAAQPAEKPSAKSAATKPDPKSETPAAPASELDLTSINLPAPEPATSASVGPGLTRFVAVDLKLAGGSLPSTAGLDWLVEKGYRTLLDLRESSEVPPAFITEATKRGLRYVALPIGPASIDREHVARFAFEVGAGEARPLYFFDSDGTRSGALWYIRRIATDRVDQQVARREAEELGLSNQEYWSAVTKYVATLPPARTTSTSDNPRTEAGTDVLFLGSPIAAPTTALTQDAAPRTAMAMPDEPAGNAGRDLPGTDRQEQSPPSDPPALDRAQPAGAGLPPVDDALPGKPFTWRSIAAMVVTCVVPLAYWSRNLTPTRRASARASLPAPAKRS
jgi:protein tyrosine phosphatase (PTP) superfamily phosphohydrolase (DUF442 family)